MAKKTLGQRNNNPLNIRVSSNNWVGKLPSSGAFEVFQTVEHGVRAGMVILRTYFTKHKLNTVRGIISRFAPASENNTESYINYICKEVGVTADYPLRFDSVTVRVLVRAMAKLESRMHLTDQQLSTAWQMI